MSKNPPKDIADRDPKKVAFGRRLRTVREQRGFTQAELGSMVGVTDNAIIQYESGRASPRPFRIEALAQMLGVTATFLLTGDEPDQLVRAQTQPELEALEIIRDIPLEQQPAALAALRGIALAYSKKK